MPASRRLHFVVGTSLLGASLTLGCAGSKKGTDPELHANPGPDTGVEEPDSAGTPVDADAGSVEDPPEGQPDSPDADPPTADKPSDVDVNPGPQEPMTNEGPVRDWRRRA